MFARIEERIGSDAGLGDPNDGDGVDGTVGPAVPSLFSSTNESSPTPAPSSPGGLRAATEEIDTGTLTAERPQVRGVLCPNDHLTAPNELTCRTCKCELDANAKVVTADRPILGTLTFDDGAVLGVDRPAAIGANVPTGYTIESETATVVRLDDGNGGVADVQIEVRISGWMVEIIDTASSTGTYTSPSGIRHSRTRLRAGQRLTLVDAMTVYVGERSFVYTDGPPAAADEK